MFEPQRPVWLVIVVAMWSGHAAIGKAAAQSAPPPVPLKPAVDIYGDPLPPGATARLGTIRFRTAGEIEQLALAADGKTIAACSRAGVFLFDAIDGKRIQSLPI